MSGESSTLLVNTPSGPRIIPARWWSPSDLDLIRALIARELKGRYKGSVLGFLWAVIVPLFMAGIYVVFLSLLMGRGLSVERIIVGVFAWQYTAQCVMAGLNSITGNGPLVKKVLFPRGFLPLSAVLAQLFNYGLSLAVQFAVLAMLTLRGGPGVDADVLGLPLVVLWQTALNLGLALLLAAAQVHFRDTQHLVGVALSAWFFVSPVMYDLEWVRPVIEAHPWVEHAVWLNPITPILVAARACCIRSVDWNPPPAGWVGLLWTPLILGLGILVFRRAQRHFADLL